MKKKEIKIGNTSQAMKNKKAFVKEIIAGKHVKDGWHGFNCKENKPKVSI